MDTWWQTENGMILVSPLPGLTTLKPGAATRPFLGVEAAVYDEDGNEIPAGSGAGYMVVKKPWPAMFRGLYGEDERFKEAYWSKFSDAYLAGDGARVDADGDFWLMGRIDDVMNVSGHRLSTIEIESALVDHPDVAQAAVVGRSDPTTGKAIVAYVTLKDGAHGTTDKLAELREHVGKMIGPIAKPANIVFTPELPMTRSGKIMRRLLKDVAENRQLGDTTTLADPSVVEEIKRRSLAEAAKED
jgi:acetyl-CoA synthetase